jgi:diaminopimelate decarboxylase
MDEEQIRQKCRRYLQAFAANYPAYRLAFAGKAFLTLAMARLTAQEGLSLDVVSGGELYTALLAGFPAENIIFHGNNKSSEELAMALTAGVGRYVVDSFSELHLLSQLAQEHNNVAAIYLRVNPAIGAKTHHYIQTGQVDSKFGFAIGSQAHSAAALAAQLPGLELVGLHCHIGSQIMELKPFELAAVAMVNLLARIQGEWGLSLTELDLGGGLGIRYLPGDIPPSIEAYVVALTGAVKAACQAGGIALPLLVLEPGRSIVGEAGTTLYRVGTSKEVEGVRKYVAVDGGMMFNVRPALYDARYQALVANRPEAACQEQVTIAGKACESGDILIRDIQLPPLKRGDVLAEFSTGAYHFSMASNYNRFARPAVVWVREGKAAVVVRRESLADVVKNDIIPAHLAMKGE